MTFDAIVLCGGAARRLQGADKGAVVVGGSTLLDRALDAVTDASTVVAVGPTAATRTEVQWVQEEPAGGGPVSAIAAGLPLTTQPVVVILGVDFPFVDAACVARIVAAMGDRDGAILTDETGRHQFLVGAYRRAVLEETLGRCDPHGMAVKELIAGFELAVLADPRSARDCDTWEDVAEATSLIEEEM
jgi:molybdopterin-guanine dinucleotide biosynthesis protein A